VGQGARLPGLRAWQLHVTALLALLLLILLPLLLPLLLCKLPLTLVICALLHIFL
jgi:hypothetical protein